MKFKRQDGKWVAESGQVKYLVYGISPRKFMLQVAIKGYIITHPFISAREAKRFAFKFDKDIEAKNTVQIEKVTPP
jgi:hypothetical protein